MKIRFAAVTDDGQRQRADSREEIDRWCAARCAEGHYVTVYARECHGGPTNSPERVGEWRPA